MATYLLVPPHSDGQRDLILSNDNDVVFAGRRYGKTHLGTHRILRCGFEKPGLYWWVGLSWRAASMQHAWRELRAHHEGILTALKLDYRQWRSMINYELRFPNGLVIQMRTAENPESLAGAAVDGIVFDEFTMARESVWGEQLAPTLLTTNGWCLFIGVPKGLNWATRLWRWSKTQPGWGQWHFETLDNPYISQTVYDDISASMPKLMQEQELEAKIISGRGQVFRNVTECATAIWQENPTEGRMYVAGLDWGKVNDSTVLTVVDCISRELVYYDIFDGMDYVDQLDRVRAHCNHWGFRRIVAESNAMGMPLCDQLSRDGLPVEPFDMNRTTKREIIELLAVAFETETFFIPADEPLIDELASIEMNLTKQGHPQYAAPEGSHDDRVMSLALAHWGIAYRPAI